MIDTRLTPQELEIDGYVVYDTNESFLVGLMVPLNMEERTMKGTIRFIVSDREDWEFLNNFLKEQPEAVSGGMYSITVKVYDSNEDTLKTMPGRYSLDIIAAACRDYDTDQFAIVWD